MTDKVTVKAFNAKSEDNSKEVVPFYTIDKKYLFYYDKLYAICKLAHNNINTLYNYIESNSSNIKNREVLRLLPYIYATLERLLNCRDRISSYFFKSKLYELDSSHGKEVLNILRHLEDINKIKYNISHYNNKDGEPNDTEETKSLSFIIADKSLIDIDKLNILIAETYPGCIVLETMHLERSKNTADKVIPISTSSSEMDILSYVNANINMFLNAVYTRIKILKSMPDSCNINKDAIIEILSSMRTMIDIGSNK